MKKKNQWYGLKVNGNIVMVLQSDSPMTVDDFGDHDVPLTAGLKYKAVKVTVREDRS